MKSRKSLLAVLAVGAFTLSACSLDSEAISKELAGTRLPETWVKLGEEASGNSVNRIYLAPPGNTDDEFKNSSAFDVVKERPIDNTSKGELVVREKSEFLSGVVLTLTLGKVNSIDSVVDSSDSNSPIKLPATAPEICGLAPAGQELCDEFGIDKVQVVPIKATAKSTSD